MSLVSLTEVSLSFGERDILNNVSLTISNGRGVALAGANGSGKTTLMKILCGEITPDKGNVSFQKNITVSYLPQTGMQYAGCSLYTEAEKVFAPHFQKEKEMRGLEEELERHEEQSEGTEKLLQRHFTLHEELHNSGFYLRKSSIESILLGLGFSKTDLERDTSEFSGGWQMRIGLAKILLENPDLMLLDEPTNYLDIEARNWLESYLAGFKGSYLIVSHDRYFLDTTVNEVLELFNAKLTSYKGNYTEYQRKREAELIQLIHDYKKQQEYIERLENFISKFRYNASKAQQVQSRIKELEKIDRIEIPESLKKIHFTFPAPPKTGRKVITLDCKEKKYGETPVLKDIELEIERGEKVVITGVNGAGKSTLTRILAQRDKEFSGSLTYGTHVNCGYFSQNTEEQLNPEFSVLEEIESSAPLERIPHVRNLLGAFLFRGDDVFKKTGVLSGGEKSRLVLLKLLLKPYNLLVLDEPTNHLDINSKDILVEAVQSFPGTVVFVSHDRYFIENIAERVIYLSGHHAQNFAGNYSYFLWKMEQSQNTESNPVSDKNNDNSIKSIQAESDLKSTGSGKKIYEEKKNQRRQLNKLRKQESELLHTIEELETQKETLEHQLSDPEVYTHGEKVKHVSEKLETTKQKIEQLSLEWEKVTENLQEIQQI